jgi:hypothetical protein
MTSFEILAALALLSATASTPLLTKTLQRASSSKLRFVRS